MRQCWDHSGGFLLSDEEEGIEIDKASSTLRHLNIHYRDRYDDVRHETIDDESDHQRQQKQLARGLPIRTQPSPSAATTTTSTFRWSSNSGHGNNGNSHRSGMKGKGYRGSNPIHQFDEEDEDEEGFTHIDLQSTSDETAPPANRSSSTTSSSSTSKGKAMAYTTFFGSSGSAMKTYRDGDVDDGVI